MNPRTPSLYKPDQNTDGVAPQDIIDKAIENRHIGDGEITLVKLANEVLTQLEKVANRITVATDGGNYESIFEAMDGISDNSITNPYIIDVYPGVYLEPNPITCKPFVYLVGHGVVIIDAQNSSQNVLELERSSFVIGITIQNATNGRAIYKNTTGSSLIRNITIIDCLNSVCIDNASGLLFAENITLLAITTSINRGIEVLSGNVNYRNVNLSLAGIQTCTDFFYFTSASSIVTIDGVSSFSSGLVNGFRILNGPNCVLRSVSFVGMDVGYKFSGAMNVRMHSCDTFDAKSYGLHVDSTAGISIIGMSGCEFKDAALLDIFIECSDCTIQGSGITTNTSKISIIAGAFVNLLMTDIFPGDEGTAIWGELHVGTPVDPTESVFGEGDSHVNMLIYTESSGGVFTDVTEEAESVIGSTFTFPGIAPNNAIYVANILNDGSSNLKHHGIKYISTVAGVLGGGEIVAEYWNGSSWIEFNGMITDGNIPFLPYEKQYFETTGEFQLRYNPLMVNDSWVVNDPITPAVETSYFWTRFRIKTGITTAPIFQQFKIHSSRSEKNGDGYDEFFGNARNWLQLPVNIGSAKPFEGAMQNQTIYIDQDLGVGYQVNKFTATSDKLGFAFTIPNNIDTSAPILIRWTGAFNTSHTPEFTIRWAKTSPEDTVYFSEPGASSNPSTQSDTVSKAIILNRQEWFEIYLDISTFIARRDTEFPDFLTISIQPSTLSGTFSLMDLQAYYLVWGIGGHVD